MKIHAKRSLWSLVAALLGVVPHAASAQSTAPAAPALTLPAVRIHGFAQNRLYAAPGANPSFRTERVSVSADATLPNDSLARVEVYYHPWSSSSGLYLESAYYDAPFGPGRVRVGKGRRITFGIVPAYPNRRTASYGIVSEAFTQDRVQGIQYVMQRGQVDLALGLHTAYRLGTRQLGEVPGDDLRNNPVAGTPAGSPPLRAGHVVPHLALRDLPGALSRHPQISGRVGLKTGFGLQAGLSAAAAALDQRDLDSLRGVDNALRPRNPLTDEFPTAPLGPAFTRDRLSQAGLDLTYKSRGGFVLQGEGYGAKVSDLEYHAWNLLAGWEVPPQGFRVPFFEWRVPTGWKLYARYGAKEMDTPITNNPLTWDARQLTLSLVQPLTPGVWLQYEAEFNQEDTHTGGKVRNDLFFAELFTGF